MPAFLTGLYSGRGQDYVIPSVLIPASAADPNTVLIIVFSFGGTVCNDDRGNTYTAGPVHGSHKTWYSYPATAIQPGDHITVTGANGVDYLAWQRVRVSSPIINDVGANSTVSGNNLSQTVHLPDLTITYENSFTLFAGALLATASPNFSNATQFFVNMVRVGGTALTQGTNIGHFGHSNRFTTTTQSYADASGIGLRSAGTVQTDLQYDTFDAFRTLSTEYGAVAFELVDVHPLGPPPGTNGQPTKNTRAWIDREGLHHVIGVNATGVAYFRTDTAAGSIRVRAQITSTATDKDPALIRDLSGQVARLWAVFSRGGDTYRLYGTDDGETWSSPVSVIAGGTHPNIAIQPRTGAVMIAAYVAGVIKGVVQYPGDSSPSSSVTFKDDAGANLAPGDDTFGLVAEYGSVDRWLLTITKGGAIHRYQSWDETGMTWIEIT